MVCTANLCRSPTAEGLLRLRLATGDVGVSSAGFLEPGHPVPYEVGEAAGRVGVDLSAHRSQQVSSLPVGEMDLVLGMARQHVRETVLLEPAIWPRAFTLVDFLRRARTVGQREPAQPFDQWVASVHHGRRHADLLGSGQDDEVADPIGGPMAGYDDMTQRLDTFIGELTRLAWPPSLL
jgi:protein-tyrosine phosphatase